MVKKQTKTKTKQTGGKRKMNEYFKKMLQAKKNNDQSFTYKTNTYVQKTTKTGMKIYKKK